MGTEYVQIIGAIITCYPILGIIYLKYSRLFGPSHNSVVISTDVYVHESAWSFMNNCNLNWAISCNPLCTLSRLQRFSPVIRLYPSTNYLLGNHCIYHQGSYVCFFTVSKTILSEHLISSYQKHFFILLGRSSVYNFCSLA